MTTVKIGNRQDVLIVEVSSTYIKTVDPMILRSRQHKQHLR